MKAMGMMWEKLISPAVQLGRDFDIRLSGGETIHKGRLEVYYGEGWGAVCVDRWDEQDARVVCRELGFGEPLSYLITSRYGRNSSQPIWLDDVVCNGLESRLSTCYSELGSSVYCNDSGVVALECKSPEEFSIRLVNGMYENVGQLEIFNNGEWSGVCFHQWSETNSQVACKQLGYLRSDYYKSFNFASYPVTFNCTGVESTLQECSSSPYEVPVSFCRAVDIKCTNEDFDIRLSGGETKYKGRLEVYYGGEWGAVCVDGWSERNAHVVCRELGFGEPLSYLITSRYGRNSSQPIWLDDVMCNGLEYRLSTCYSKLGGSVFCNESGIVALECKSPDETEFSIRLMDGIFENVGRLEIFNNGEWSHVCYDQWLETNSQVACKQLGYLRSDMVTDIHNNGVYNICTPYHFNFKCAGVESTLQECNPSPYEITFCFAVNIQCTNEDEKYSKGNVHLVGGGDDSEGILEVYLYGVWGTMCSRNWNEVNSEVVCKQLGYKYTAKKNNLLKYNASVVDSLPVHKLSFYCNKDEENLSSCKKKQDIDSTCNHTEDVAVACSNNYFLEEDFSIRLVNGVYENVGQLEILNNGEWSRACKQQWSETNSQVACKQLGYLRSDDWPNGYYISNRYAPYLLNFNCTGVESNLRECSPSPSEVLYCSAVNIQCTNEEEYYSQGDVHLVGGDDSEGLLEVYLYGIWGTMCSRNWTDSNSKVVCRQLGLFDYGKDYGSFEYDTTVVSSLPVHNVSLNCYGFQSSLSSCSQEKDSMCIRHKDVALSCTGTSWVNLDDGSLSGGAIAGIVIGVLSVCFQFCVCILRLMKTSKPTTDDVTTTPPTTSIPLVLQTNGNQDVPSVFPGPENQPLTYDSVMQEPDRYKDSTKI